MTHGETRVYQMINADPSDKVTFLKCRHVEVTHSGKPSKTVTEHLWDSLRSKFEPPKPKPSLEELKRTQWCGEFETLMRNRLIMGAMRYETFDDKRRTGCSYDYIASITSRLKKYQETGNTEHLVDAANCLMLEFEFGNHPTKHFSSIDDGEHVAKKG